MASIRAGDSGVDVNGAVFQKKIEENPALNFNMPKIIRPASYVLRDIFC